MNKRNPIRGIIIRNILRKHPNKDTQQAAIAADRIMRQQKRGWHVDGEKDRFFRINDGMSIRLRPGSAPMSYYVILTDEKSPSLIPARETCLELLFDVKLTDAKRKAIVLAREYLSGMARHYQDASDDLADAVKGIRL